MNKSKREVSRSGLLVYDRMQIWPWRHELQERLPLDVQIDGRIEHGATIVLLVLSTCYSGSVLGAHQNEALDNLKNTVSFIGTREIWTNKWIPT